MTALLNSSTRALGLVVVVPARSASSSASFERRLAAKHAESSEAGNVASSSKSPCSGRTAARVGAISICQGAVTDRYLCSPRTNAQRSSARFYTTPSGEPISSEVHRDKRDGIAEYKMHTPESLQLLRERRSQRESERWLMERDLTKYSFTSPAGTIAGMRKTEEEMSAERSALHLSLGEHKDGERVAVTRFFVPTLHLLQTRTDSDAVLKRVRSGEMLSFDMEWTSNWTTRMPNRTSLVQVATATDIFVLQIGIMKGIPRELVRILEDQSILKCGVAIHNDATKFRHDYDVSMQGCLELSSIAKAIDFGRWKERQSSLIALRDLCRVYLDRRLAKDKRLQVGRWDLKKLNDDQVHYAATDAYVGLEIIHAICSLAVEGHSALKSHTAAFLQPNVVAALELVIGKPNTALFTGAAMRLVAERAGEDGNGIDVATTKPYPPESGSSTPQQSTPESKAQQLAEFGPFFGKAQVVETASEEEEGVSASEEEKQASFSRALQSRMRVAAQNEAESRVARAATKEFSFRHLSRLQPAQRRFLVPKGQTERGQRTPSFDDFLRVTADDSMPRGGRRE